jgi:hypothetical protein
MIEPHQLPQSRISVNGLRIAIISGIGFVAMPAAAITPQVAATVRAQCQQRAPDGNVVWVVDCRSAKLQVDPTEGLDAQTPDVALIVPATAATRVRRYAWESAQRGVVLKAFTALAPAVTWAGDRLALGRRRTAP